MSTCADISLCQFWFCQTNKKCLHQDHARVTTKLKRIRAAIHNKPAAKRRKEYVALIDTVKRKYDIEFEPDLVIGKIPYYSCHYCKASYYLRPYYPTF